MTSRSWGVAGSGRRVRSAGRLYAGPLQAAAVVGAVVVLALTGLTVPAQAAHYPGKRQANKIWQQLETSVGQCPNRVTPRRGIRISDVQARGARWAAVNITMTRCANGVLLAKKPIGGTRWRHAGSFGSDFSSGNPDACSNVAGMPNRVVIDLTGMTCRGGRTQPTVITPNPWF